MRGQLLEELNDPHGVLGEVRTNGDPSKLPRSRDDQVALVREVLRAVERLAKRRGRALGIPEEMYR